MGVSGPNFGGQFFEGQIFDFSEKVFLIVFGSGAGPPRDQRHRGARARSGNVFLIGLSFDLDSFLIDNH